MTWGRSSAQQSFRAQIFIQVRPMNAVSAAGNLPIPKLLRRGVEKSRIPGQGHRDGASILQGNAERVIRKTHSSNPFVSLQGQNTHSMPLSISRDSLPPSIV